MQRRVRSIALAPWCLPLVLATLTTTAWAGPTAVDPANAKRATDLFRAGRAAAAAGDDKTACERFTESDALQLAPGTELNLGACEAKQGHLLAAREHFRKAGAGFKPEDVRRAVAINSANDLTDRLPVLTVHAANGVPPGIQVTLEGAPLDMKVLEHGIELDPGTTKLVVSVEGRKPRQYEVVLREAEKRDLAVDVGEPLGAAAVVADVPVPPPTLAALPAPVDDGNERRKLEHTLGFVGVGVGGAGILVGSIFGVLAFNEAGKVRANCTTTYACRPAGVSAAASGRSDGVVSTTMFVLGGVLGAAGVYLTVRTWKTTDKQASALRLTPLALPQGGGALATWSY